MQNWPHRLHGIAFEYRRIRRQGFPKLLLKAVVRSASMALWFPLLPATIALHLAGFRRVTVFTDRIGHLALEPDCLLKEQALGLVPKRQWFILAPPERVANEHLLKYWEPYFRIYRGRFLCFILASMSRWGLMRADISRYINAATEAQAAYRIYAQWGTRPPILSLTQADEAWGAHALREMGLPDGAWFVCVHVREPGFSPVDEELHAHRNGSIEATIPAMHEIAKRGGWIIRIGDPTMKKLPSLPQAIDYAHHPMKCERLDIILCAKARFILGNTSGISLVGSVFGVPCAIANMIPITSLWFGAADISIPKMLWSISLHRYLSFNEAVTSPIADYRYARLYQEAGIRAEENSAEDIRSLVLEMLDRLEGRFPENDEDKMLQRQFRGMVNEKCAAKWSNANTATLFLRKYFRSEFLEIDSRARAR